MKRRVWQFTAVVALIVGIVLAATGSQPLQVDYTSLSMWLIVLGGAILLASFQWMSFLLILFSVVALVLAPFAVNGGSWGTWLMLSVLFGLFGIIGIVTGNWDSDSDVKLAEEEDSLIATKSEPQTKESLIPVAENFQPTPNPEVVQSVNAPLDVPPGPQINKFCTSCGQARMAEEKFCTACGVSYS